MKLVAALALVLGATSVAQADAPGETAPIETPPPGYVVAAPPPMQPSVMANRWAIAFSIGSESLAPKGSSGDPTDATQFAIGELALRYRLAPRLELEATVGGGREQLPNGGGQGDLQVTTAAIGARYRFRPACAWNWYLSGGVGSTTVASAEATADEKTGHAHVQLGVGVERRFTHLALSAELRAIAVAGGTDASPSQIKSDVVLPASAAGDSGGELTIGASYYF
jgi:hypothetical protein